MKQFVNASAFDNAHGYEGVVEVIVRRVDFSIEMVEVQLPNKERVKVSYQDLYDECKEGQLNNFNESIRLRDSLYVKKDGIIFRYNKEQPVAFVHRGELVSGLATLSVYDADLNECEIIVCDGRYKFEGHKFYGTADECLKVEEVKITKEDGTEEIVGGHFNKFRLTDEQMLLVGELRDVIYRCERAGISIFCDTDNGELKALNTKDNEGVQVDEMWREREKYMIPDSVAEVVYCMTTVNECWNYIDTSLEADSEENE